MKRYDILLGALPALAALAFTSCSQEENISSGNERELTGISTQIGTTRTVRTTSDKEPLYVGRSSFVGGDNINMTHFGRTANTIEGFTYSNILWEKKTDESGWTRVDDSGKIYWSDATSAHTFIGYSMPYEDFPWTKTTAENMPDVYHGQLTLTDGIVDYTNTTDADGNEVSGNEKLKKDDIVLAYSTEVVADATGIGTVDFRHALSCLTFDLNINGFSSTAGIGDDEKDNATRVISLVVHNQPYQYKWAQTSDCAEEETGSATADVKAWTNNMNGDATTSGRNRRFYYHTLAVPGTRSSMSIEFTVTYPDPLNTANTLTNTYTATATNVELIAGKRTTIKISLNHQNETMTVGAEYNDWDYVNTPDHSELTKKSTFLTSTTKANIHLHDESGLIRDDATWLYTDSDGNVLDVDGNDGSEDNPYTISSANQFLAFAYEVNEGKMTFEGKYVSLNASLYMQPSTTGTSMEWIGIGTSQYPFKGHFDGRLHDISRLKGKSLFGYVAEGATVSGVTLTTMLGTTDGGCVATNNAGTISGCMANGDVTGTSYAGGICETNSGTIIACAHIGSVTATTAVGTVAGKNTGTATAVYATSKLSATTVVVQCYYDKTMYTSATDEEAERWGKTSTEMLKQDFVTLLNQEIGTATTYRFVYRPSQCPTIQ